MAKGQLRDLGPYGITVNPVHPGPIDTDSNPAGGTFADTDSNPAGGTFADTVRGFTAQGGYAEPGGTAAAAGHLVGGPALPAPPRATGHAGPDPL